MDTLKDVEIYKTGCCPLQASRAPKLKTALCDCTCDQNNCCGLVSGSTVKAIANKLLNGCSEKLSSSQKFKLKLLNEELKGSLDRKEIECRLLHEDG